MENRPSVIDMDIIEFKNLFSEVAKLQGFDKAFKGWFKKSNECIVILDLQKSKYGNWYQLMIKIYVQGMFNQQYAISKDLVKRSGGNAFRGQPPEYKDVLDLTAKMNDNQRVQKISFLFSKFITPFVNQALFKAGLNQLEAQGELFLLPAVKEQLNI